jgi:hypothetical protein
MKKILLDLDEIDYSQFSKNLQEKISVNTVRLIYEFALDKKDKNLLVTSKDFIRKNIQGLKDANIWPLDEISIEINDILYPSKK